MRKFCVALIWLCGVHANLAAADPVPLEHFARTDAYDSPSLSPDGKYLAMRYFNGENYEIAVIERGAGKKPTRIAIGRGSSVYEYVWASPTRLVVSLAADFDAYDAPLRTGEIMAVDVDGKRAHYLFGARGGDFRSGHTASKDTRENAYGYLLRTLPNDPDHVLIAYYNWNALRMDRNAAVVARINTFTGKRDSEVRAPLPGWVRFSADASGFVRFASGANKKLRRETYVRSPEAPEWRLLSSVDSRQRVGGDDAGVVSAELSPDGRFVYMVSNELTGRYSLLAQDVASGEIHTLSSDDERDIEAIVRSPLDDEPVAALYEGGIPRLDIVETDTPGAALLRGLQKAFPGMIAYPVSRTADGRLAVIRVYSDRNPGDYYLFDVVAKKADYLGGARDWINPEQMGERRPVMLQARDGTTLRGFLTLPPDRDPSQLPMVVLPHGGPFGVQDTWAWEPDAQMLASRGYAVLQINFRGSGGFGADFRLQGRKAWHTHMIDDITDATRWAVAQGYADAHRLCIYGGSYGGYAALMSAVREPDLYRCVAGYVGLYDLPLWRREFDGSRSRLGRQYVAEEVGSSTEELWAASPIAYLDRLKAPVLIAHGKRDQRVPYSQAERLRDALEKRGHPYEWFVADGEGHGFYRSDNRLRLYEKLLMFLDRHIGVPTAADAAPVAP